MTAKATARDRETEGGRRGRSGGGKEEEEEEAGGIRLGLTVIVVIWDVIVCLLAWLVCTCTF